MNVIPIPLKVATIYLIPYADGFVQVDTGYAQDYAAYRKGLAKAGVALAGIKYLFLTHHHDDHAGFLNDLTRDTPLTIIANRRAKELLLTGKNDAEHGGGLVSPMLGRMVPVLKKVNPQFAAGFPPFALREQDILIDGDDNTTMRSIGLPAQILFTPGHTIDHQVLLLDSGEAFCGDAASSFMLIAGTHYATVMMTDMEAAYRSWQKMLDAGARTLYPSHGKPFPARKLPANMGKIKTEKLIPLS